MSGHLLKSNDLDVAKSKNIHMIIGCAVICCGHAVEIKGAALAVTSPSNSRKKDTTYVILHL